MELDSLKSDEDDLDPEIIRSENLKPPILLVSYGDLYVVGRLWIHVLKTALLGTEVSLFPVVEAAQKPQEGPPKKPGLMKYKDLPLYTSPHFDYKDHVESTYSCPKAKTKLLQEYLLPHVNSLRKCTQHTYCGLKCSLTDIKDDICEAMKSAKCQFKRQMRDPDNLLIRRVVVALGATTGFVLSSGRGLPRRLFFAGLGTLATGALCFPKETDEVFRGLSYHTAKAGLAFYNLLCGKDIMLRERLLCKEDLPPPPPMRKTNPCTKKDK